MKLNVPQVAVVGALGAAVVLGMAGTVPPSSAQPSAVAATTPTIATVPGMPPVADPANLYSETAAGKFSPAVAGDLARVYVPHVTSNDVYVIDPATMKVVDKFKAGVNPQHVVPVVGPGDAVGRQQRRGPQRRQPHADRPARPASRASRSPSTTRTTCIRRRTASR